MQKIMNANKTKDPKVRNRLLLFKLGCMLIIVMLLAGLSNATVHAATGLKIYDYATKKNMTYTGKQVKVNLNGKQISKNETPGILVDGIALLSYKDIFANSPIKATCVYNKPEGTVTISKNNTTIVLTLNSKTAVVNGKKVTMPVAPIKIKYNSANVTKILVPSRFVAENLGYQYTWYSAKNTVEIKGEIKEVKEEKKESADKGDKKEDGFMISINQGEKFAYTGAFADLTIDGAKLDLGNMRSIIIDNTTMVRAKRVFADSKIKATYSFDSKTNTVTLTKDGNELKMVIGEKTAYLNGKSVKMDAPAMVVTNYASKTNYVMVPGRFTATSLGYDYTWNQSKRTSEIVTIKKPSDNNQGSNPDNTAPELGDDSVVPEQGTILRQWLANEKLLGKSTNAHELTYNGQSTDDIGIISINLNNFSQQYINVETYQFQASKPYGKIVSSIKENQITIQVPGMMSAEQYLTMSGSTKSVIDRISAKYDNASSTTTIELLLVQDNVPYDLVLSADRRVLSINLYKNSITSATVGTNTKGDYLTLTGIRPLDVSVQNQGGFLMLDLPYTINGIGDQYYAISNAKLIKQFFAVGLDDRTQIYLELQNNAEYYITENGNWFSLSIQPKGTVTQPEIPDKEEEEIPGNFNKNDFQVIIPKPEGVTRKQISDEDYYLNKQFVITLDGNYVSYFDSHPIEIKSGAVRDVTVKFINNKTEIRFTTSKIQGYKYEVDNSYIYLRVDNPKNIYKNIVVLDPGHGGGADGAKYFGTKEKDLNFKMLYTLGKKYFNSETSEIKAYYTRTTDKDVDLYDRAAFAKEVGADLFVSLHMNASTSASAQGTEVYYSTSNNTKNSSGLDSKTLATKFVNKLSTLLGTKNRGTNTAKFVVVHKNTVPAVLIELGFMSNQSDYNKLTNATNQENVAKTIYETLCEVFKQYPTGR